MEGNYVDHKNGYRQRQSTNCFHARKFMAYKNKLSHPRIGTVPVSPRDQLLGKQVAEGSQ